MRIYQRKTFNPEQERLWPRRERLYEQMGEQRYLNEVLNPFRQMMAEEFPRIEWLRWDNILLVYSPTSGPDSLLEEWEWGIDKTQSERQPV